MTLFWHFLSLLTTGAYYLTQAVLPNFILTGIANLMPVWKDSFAPRAFFEPKPQALEVGGTKPSLSWMGSNLLNKIILHRGVHVEGLVSGVEVRPKNAEWQHDTYYIHLFKYDQGCLNRFNALMTQSYAGQANDLKVLVPIGSPMPKLDDHVLVDGDQAADGANGWIVLLCDANGFTKYRA